jgi:hypothetical protein
MKLKSNECDEITKKEKTIPINRPTQSTKCTIKTEKTKWNRVLLTKWKY